MKKRIDCLTLACENYREEMEKNLADAVKLEKENAELKADNGFTVSAMTEQQLKVALEKGEQLEKENAELKERNRELVESCEGAKMMYKDLCKAKEIIKTFLGFADTFGYSPSMDKFITDTKQFISEVENDR